MTIVKTQFCVENLSPSYWLGYIAANEKYFKLLFSFYVWDIKMSFYNSINSALTVKQVLKFN